MAKTIKDLQTFFENSKNLMTFGQSFATSRGQPLDLESIFTSKAAAEEYAKGAGAYVGKIVVVAEGDAGQEVVTAYVINSDNTLKAIGDKGTMDDLAAKIKALQEKDVAHDESITALGEKDTELDGKIATNTEAIATKAAKTEAIGTVEAGETADKITVKSVDGTTIKKTITVNDVAHAVAADNATTAADVSTTINKHNISDIFETDGVTAKNATTAANLGEHAAADYQLSSELKALAKKDKVAKGDLDTALSAELDAKAVAETVNAELALKATVVAQEATEAKAQKNKEDIAAMDTAYKAADTAIKGRLDNIESAYIKSVEYTENTGLFKFTLQDGKEKEVDLAIEKVVTNFVYDADKQALVLTLADKTTQEVPLSSFIKDYTAAQGAKEVQLAISAGKEISATLVKSVKDDIAKGVDAQTRVAAVEGEVDTLNAKPAFGITSDQISNWNTAKTQSDTNKQGLADLKAVVDNEATGLVATKAIADANKLAIEDSKTGLAKAHEKADANAADIVNLKAADTKHTQDIAANAKAIEGKEDAGKAQELINGLSENLTGTPAADSTITALSQVNGVVTATVGKIAIAQDQVTDLDIALAGKVDVAENSRLMTNAEGQSLADLVALKPAEANAQANVIEAIKLAGETDALAIGDAKTVELPLATALKAGLVKGSTGKDKIKVEADGTMSINTVSLSKIEQDVELILDGGKAAK